MVKKLETQELVTKLNQTSRKTKKVFWKNIASILEKPTRNKISININNLDKLANKFKGKTLLVPGKILSMGELNTKTKVIAVEASAKAIEKINSKGELILLKNFISEKANIKDVIIVK